MKYSLPFFFEIAENNLVKNSIVKNRSNPMADIFIPKIIAWFTLLLRILEIE